MPPRGCAVNRDRLAVIITTLLDESVGARRAGRNYALPAAWCDSIATELGEWLHELRPAVEGCLTCGAALVQPATGRRRKYCPRPATCRDKAARAA